MKTKTQMGGMWPQAQGCLEPQNLEEAGRTLPSEPLEGAPFPTWISVVLPRLDLSGPALPGSQTLLLCYSSHWTQIYPHQQMVLRAWCESSLTHRSTVSPKTTADKTKVWTHD